MNVQRLAAFADNNSGGNPAGVLISDKNPSASAMQSIAADVGYSETAFAEPADDGWRVRYFSPETEVPFCGHATIALGAALAEANGSGIYPLELNNTHITVEGFCSDNTHSAALQSPATRSAPAEPALISEALDLFCYNNSDLDTRIPPGRANGGAEHLIIGLKSRAALHAMQYDLDQGRVFMRDNNLVTLMFVYAEGTQRFHSRNAFASGGVYEDPATGAATVAFAGYLRDLNWPHEGDISLIQGEDMGCRSLINATFSNVPESSIRVSGQVRFIDDDE